jgi:hypothetical protein
MPAMAIMRHLHNMAAGFGKRKKVRHDDLSIVISSV